MSLLSISRLARPISRLARRGLPPVVALAVIGGSVTVLAPPATAAPDQRPRAAATKTAQATKTAPMTKTVRTTTLVARATLSADYHAPGPPSGALATPANGRTGPFPGQVIPGFSAAVANGDGTFWALPDNGFGSKANSADFRLRIYLVKPNWDRGTRGPGGIDVLRFVSLADPGRKIGFTITRGNTPKRLLTGGDLDIESLQRAADGSFWIGEEFGPFLLHFSPVGRLLSAPVPFPLGQSPQSPLLGDDEPNTERSGGFEAMAQSANHRYLYPVVEKALVDDTDRRRRVIAEFDTRRGRYTGRTWDYRVDTDANLVADAQVTRGRELLILERDDFDGDASVTKRVYRVNLGRTDRSGNLAKTLVTDLLKINNPKQIGTGDGWGTGDPFAFGFQSVETLVVLRGGRLMIANDNNYPGNSARRPGTPDDTEMIIIDPDARTEVPTHSATVIGHRGASGYRPEHTLAAYELAIRQCADVIEPDVVLTKDGVPVARHENEIGGTTDVAKHPELADRRTTKTIDGRAVTGWFTEDLTLAELRTLRAVERLPLVRPTNTAFDGLYPVPTLAEVLDLARHSRTCSGEPVGVAPETKHPTYFASIGLPLEKPLLRALKQAGLDKRSSPVIIQSFETGNLKRLNTMTKVPLSQLVDCSGAPYDLKAAGDPRTYADLATAPQLAEIARYADSVGFCRDVMIPRTKDGNLAEPTSAIDDAHTAGLEVIGWTFRRENAFLPAEFRRGTDPAGVGDLAGEIRVFIAAGLDGFFTDNPDLGSTAASTPLGN